MEKSKTGKIILIIIVSLVLLAGIILGILFLINKGSNENGGLFGVGKKNEDLSYLYFIEKDEKNNCNVYIDKNGNVKKISTEKYKIPTGNIYDNCIIVKDEKGNNLVVDSNLNVLLDESYKVTDKSRDCFKIYKDGKYSVINKEGKVIVAPTEKFIRLSAFEKNNCVVIEVENGKNGDSTAYDIYTSVSGKKVMSKFSDHMSLYSKINGNGGILDLAKNNVERTYINASTGEEIARGGNGKYIGVRPNCCVEISDSNARNNTIKFFDKQMKLSKEVKTQGDSAWYLNDFVIIDSTVYDYEGNVINNLKFDSGESFYGRAGNFIKTKANKKYNIYTVDGKKIISDLDKDPSSSEIEKDNKLFISKGTSAVTVEKRNNNEAYVNKINDSDRYYEISYRNTDGFQIFDLEKQKVIWDNNEKGSAEFLENVNVIKIENTYYNYNGEKIYEKTK
ncbi:MAG: hypothetical protein IJH39_06045 [Clostridia bacterium]|nr:hypothetical protein [Clostridia bacterium]